MWEVSGVPAAAILHGKPPAQQCITVPLAFGRSDIAIALPYQVVKLVAKGVKAQDFRHIKVSNSPGRAIFSIVPSYLCLVFRGIISVSTVNRTALHATYVHSQEIASLARSPGSSLFITVPSISRYVPHQVRHMIVDCNNASERTHGHQRAAYMCKFMVK